MRWFFALARLYLERTNPVAATQVTKQLSRRIGCALMELHLPNVKRIFEKKHGSISAAQYRYVCPC